MNLDEAVHALLFRRRDEPAPAGHLQPLGDGVLHVDYTDDPDHVYLVTVRQVRRVRLPLEAPVVIGEAAGVRALLVGVCIANHVELTIDAEDGPAARAAVDEHRAAAAAWAERAVTNRDEISPSWPAEAFMGIPVSISDDAGTEYRSATGQAGGDGAAWQVRWDFLPVPPPEARRLTLRFPAGEVEISLPGRP